MKIEIIKSMNWHTVKLTIWNQTFSLQEHIKDDQCWSLKYAKIEKQMLKNAIIKLRYPFFEENLMWRFVLTYLNWLNPDYMEYERKRKENLKIDNTNNINNDIKYLSELWAITTDNISDGSNTFWELYKKLSNI
jgi:hypothetical protein